MAKFAEGTPVPVSQTKIEIEETLRRFRADGVLSGYEGAKAFIAFRARDRMVRITLDMPSLDAKEFGLTPAGRTRDAAARQTAYEAECRRRWRALGALVKAKVVAVEERITTFEEAFLPYVVLPDNRTVYEHTKDRLAQAYETGQVPRLLPGPAED